MSRNLHFDLDLGFSDGCEGENVRQNTMEGHGASLVDAVDLLKLEGAVNFSLLSTLGGEHPEHKFPNFTRRRGPRNRS